MANLDSVCQIYEDVIPGSHHQEKHHRELDDNRKDRKKESKRTPSNDIHTECERLDE